MAKPDLYKILGVATSASDDDIRKSHRSKARQLHPDINKAPDSQKKFSELYYGHSGTERYIIVRSFFFFKQKTAYEI